MTKIFNRVTEKEKRCRLRNNLTKAEQLFWNRIKNRQVNGKKFRKQVSIGAYIVDFYCAQLKLIVEIDGEIHNTPQAQEYDAYRDTYIQSLGLTVIRFTNDDILNNIDAVIDKIKTKLL